MIAETSVSSASLAAARDPSQPRPGSGGASPPPLGPPSGPTRPGSGGASHRGFSDATLTTSRRICSATGGQPGAFGSASGRRPAGGASPAASRVASAEPPAAHAAAGAPAPTARRGPTRSGRCQLLWRSAGPTRGRQAGLRISCADAHQAHSITVTIGRGRRARMRDDTPRVAPSLVRPTARRYRRRSTLKTSHCVKVVAWIEAVRCLSWQS